MSAAPRSEATPRPRRALAVGSLVMVACGLTFSLTFCVHAPPSDIDDLCTIFAERRSWHEATRTARERWGVPEAVQLAVIHQESRFRPESRAPRRRVLWIFPGARRSSAEGYGQVTNGAWEDYQRSTGRTGADRDDFADVADFIGWYADRLQRMAGIATHDAYRLYLAYHEGATGFQQRRHLAKPWLLDVARRVEARAHLYQSQYDDCAERLGRHRRWIFF